MVGCLHCEGEARRQKLCWRHYRLLSVNKETPRQRCKFCRSPEHRSGLCWKHYKRLNKKQQSTERVVLEENP
jgi:phage tail protein X